MFIIRGTFVHTPNLGQLDILTDHLITVNDDGFITHFSPADSPASQSLIMMTIDPSSHSSHSSHSIPIPILSHLKPGSFITPTFCDLHLHAPQFMYSGNGLDLPLMEWLDKYTFKAEESIDRSGPDGDLAKRVYRRLAERLVEYGTGAVLLFGTIKEETNLVLAQSMQSAGLRAFIGKLSMDISSRPTTTYTEPSISASLSSAASFIQSCSNLVHHLPPHRRLVEPVLTPRFVPTCSDELLAGLAELAREKKKKKGVVVRVQSHLAEAEDQVKWVQKERGMNDIDVFDRAGLLTPNTIQAHCTYLSPPDLAHLHNKGTSIAHCPLSNVYFSARPFPLREALREGVKVGLGTDIAGGYSVDIMSAMRQAVVVSRMRENERVVVAAGTTTPPGGGSLAVDWKETLYLATRGGAIALGLPKGTGTFEVGAPFDAQQINVFDDSGNGIGPLDFFDDKTEIDQDVVEKWWCIGDTRNRNKVWVQGVEVGH